MVNAKKSNVRRGATIVLPSHIGQTKMGSY